MKDNRIYLVLALQLLAVILGCLVLLGFANFIGNFKFAQSSLNLNISWFVFGPAGIILAFGILCVRRNKLSTMAEKYKSKIKFYIILSTSPIVIIFAFAVSFMNATALPTLLFGAIRPSFVVLNGVHHTCKYNVQCGTKERSIHYNFPGRSGTAHYFSLSWFPMYHFDILPSSEVKSAKPGSCLRLFGPTTIFGVWVQQVTVVNQSFCKTVAQGR